MGTLNDYYTQAAAVPPPGRRWTVGAGYKLNEYVRFGYSSAAARSAILSLPSYANALTAAGLTATFNAIDSGLGTGAALRSIADGVVAAGTAIVVNQPAGVAAGDLLVAVVVDRGANTDTCTPAAGFAEILNQARGSVGKLFVYTKVATGSEPASYTFTTSASGTQIAAVGAFTGVNQVTPIDSSAGATATVATGIHTCPSITTTAANTLLLRIVGTAVGALPSSWTWPAPAVEILDDNSVGTGAGGLSIATEPQVSPGATGTRDATFAQSSSTTFVAATIALAPA